MKCTNNSRVFRNKRNRKKQLTLRLIGGFGITFLIITACLLMFGSRRVVEKYESATYNKPIYQASLFADNLCVTNEEVEFEEFYRHDKFHGALLFNVEDNEVLYSEKVHDKLYPASTTKIMTTYVALKYGDLESTATVSKNTVSVPADSSSAGLRLGDRLTLQDLLYGLMLPSGNDSAIAIAEQVSGSVEKFVELMNEEARKLGATNTHFVNPHGYHDKEHYTTAYDLYLMLNACIKDERFIDIISSKKWSTVITQKDGSTRAVTWNQSNRFINGNRETPHGITMIGGKTGTTYEAGYCLTQYGKDSKDTPYISMIMGATSSRNLYDNMTFLWAAIPD